MLKIGFIKEYELDNGYTANCWIIGQIVKQFEENEPTSLTEPKKLKVDLVLYKDIDAFMNNKLSTKVKRSNYVYATPIELNEAGLIDKCISDIKSVDEYFSDATIIEVPIE